MIGTLFFLQIFTHPSFQTIKVRKIVRADRGNMDECQDGHPENLIMPLLLTAHPQQVSHSTAEHANKLTNLD